MMGTNPKRTECPVCHQKVFNLAGHTRVHNLEKPFKCRVCSRCFSERSNLRRHEQILHQNAKRFSCVFCEKLQSDKPSRDDHLLRHIQEKPHFCEMCSMSFCGKQELGRHLLSHVEEKHFKCRFCKKFFSSLMGLKLHESTHASKIARPYQCDQCFKSFPVKSTLKMHIRGVHNSSRSFRCPKCPKAFKSSKGLELHDKGMHHHLERTKSCVFCLKNFRDNPALFQHIFSHTKEKPCMCRVCGKAFGVNGKRKRHEQTHGFPHGLRRKNSCVFCPKKFEDRHCLNRHYLSHTNERPYSCRVCGNSFRDNGKRQRHENAIHFDELIGRDNSK